MHWKTRAGRCIYQNADHTIFVQQNLLYRWLTFGNGPVQSLIHRYQPTRPALEYVTPLILAAQQQPGTTCLFGLGGCAIPHVLSKANQRFKLDVIEENAEVIRLAARFFMSSRLPNLNIIQQDAAYFVRYSTAHYQHLLIDLFNAEQFPPHCDTLTFFQASQARLNPQGFLAVNVVGAPALRRILTHLNQLFSRRTLLLPVPNTTNTIVLAYNGADINPLLNLARQAPQTQQLVWDSEWGYVARVC